MAYKVVIPQDITDAGKSYLLERQYEVVVGAGKTDFDTLRAEIADADAVLIRTAKYPAEVLKAAKKLRVIGRHGVGVDNIDMDYCKGNNIVVTYTPEANANSVAEHTIGFIFALATNAVRLDREIRKGHWEIRDKIKGADVAGKTLGIVGFGRIGAAVARKAKLGLDMEVIAYDPYLKADGFPDYVTRAGCIGNVFACSDFVSLHLPSTPQTHKLVNHDMLGMMKRGAFLINCARGEIVSEDDLYDALRIGLIRGAALDVFEQEPPAMNNPLFDLDNVILSPHTASLTQEAMDRMGLHAAMGIDDVLGGRAPKWPVIHEA